MENNNEVQYQVDKGMDLYLKMQDNKHLLTENNKILLSQVENAMANLPENSPIKNQINGRLEANDQEKHTDINNTQNLPMVRTRQLPAESSSLRAGFINIAILLYSMINIGIILAISFLK